MARAFFGDLIGGVRFNARTLAGLQGRASDVEILVVILIIGLLVAGGIYASIQARRRREAMAQLAARLGLSYVPDKDYDFDNRFPFLGALVQGTNRYAFNILTGQYQGHAVCAFDYHYETHSTDSKGHRQTHHHYFSFFILILPGSVPELTITREGLLSKIAQFVGYDDIDFESAEFSGKFCVRSKDKKFAYDICHGRMMEYLLANPDLSVEMERHCLTLFFGSRLQVEQIEGNLRRLMDIRGMFPQYLWAQGSEGVWKS